MIRPLRATFYFNDLRTCVASLPLKPAYRRAMNAAVARLNAGRGGAVEVRVRSSQLDPRILPLFGIDTEITLVQEAPRTRGPVYTRGEVKIQMLDCTLDCGGVYVPREQTALSASKIIQALSALPRRGRTFWDIGCGSGLFGIAVKKRFPELRVVCADIANDALRTTASNARKNGVEVEVVASDLFAAFTGAQCDYLSFFSPQSARATWSASYSEYVITAVSEPTVAFASGGDGLMLLERFCGALRRHLRPNGTAWLMLGGDRCIEVINWLSPAFVCNGHTQHPLRGGLWSFTPSRARRTQTRRRRYG